MSSISPVVIIRLEELPISVIKLSFRGSDGLRRLLLDDSGMTYPFPTAHSDLSPR